MPRKNPNKGQPCSRCGGPLTHGLIYCSRSCSASAMGKRSSGRPIGYEHRSTPKAVESPSKTDLGWIAGFLEGEGSFSRTTRNKGGGSTERVTARQKDSEPLLKLQRLLGGNVAKVVYHTPSNLISMNGKCDMPMWDWSVSGSRARGVMMTLFALMSQRRRERIVAVLHPAA